MADVRALFTQHFDAARAALTQGDDPAAAESLHWAIVAARSDPSLRRELASALFHLGKLSRKFGKAGEVEAENLLNESLAISETLFGADHAAVAPLLNELSKLHFQRSQHDRAEEVLERLLAIARAKGEDNADVAMALAGLAVVKRKLGDEPAAEALYRDALRIREKVLEPNHIVTIATLEQLSETCAARGNYSEALPLLQRAVQMRELVLGPGHATVQAARTRVSEFELQLAIAADTAAVAAARAARGPIPTPAWIKAPPISAPPISTPSSTIKPSPASPTELEFLGEPEPKPATRTAPRPRERKTPAVTAAVAAASLIVSPLKTPAASQIAIPPTESTRPSESAAAHSDVILADVSYAEVEGSDVAPAESAFSLVSGDSPEPARKKRMMMFAAAAAAVVVIGIAALLMSHSKPGGGKAVATKTNEAQPAPAAVTPIVQTAATKSGSTGAAAATVGLMRADSSRSNVSAPTPAAPVVQQAQQTERAAENATPQFRAPRVDVHVGSVNLPSIPSANVDSLVRSATERQRTADSERTKPAAVSAPAPTAAADASELPRTPPKLIGRVPEPRFPNALLRQGQREGQVIVNFLVNEQGRVDVASMIVVQSDHQLFTDAVRDILPLFRFEPGRTHAPESRPVPAWVSVPFRFTTKK